MAERRVHGLAQSEEVSNVSAACRPDGIPTLRPKLRKVPRNPAFILNRGCQAVWKREIKFSGVTVTRQERLYVAPSS